MRDEFKDYPESAFYMIGTVDEAKEKAKPAGDVKPDLKAKVEVEHAAVSTHGS